MKEVRNFHTADPQMLDTTTENSVTSGGLLSGACNLCHVVLNNKFM